MNTSRTKSQQRLLFELYKRIKTHPSVMARFLPIKGRINEANIQELWQKINIIDDKEQCHVASGFTKALLDKKKNGTTMVALSSGGTSGSPKITWLSFEEMLTNTAFHGRGYVSCGIKSRDTVIAFGLPGYIESNYTAYLALRVTGCNMIPAGFDTPKNMVDLIRNTNANAVLTMPSNLIPIVAYLEDRKERLSGINLIVTGGEAMPPSLRVRLAQCTADDGVRFSSTFQTADMGTIGFQCEYCDPGEYHIHEGLQYVELMGVGGEESEIVVTNLDRQINPVVRVRTGDRAIWSNPGCKCRINSQKIKLLGRCNNYISVGGEKFDSDIFLGLGDYLGIKIENYAVKIKRSELGQDTMVICVAPGAEPKNIKNEIIAYMQERSPRLVVQQRYKTVCIEIQTLNPEQGVCSNSGKRLRIIDER